MTTLLCGLAVFFFAPAQDPSAKKDVRYPAFALEAKYFDHEVTVTINGGIYKTFDTPASHASIVPTPLKEGENVIVVSFKARPGKDLAKSRGSMARIGLSPSLTPGDGEVLELCDVVSKEGAAECVLKFEVKRLAPGRCATVERHWFDSDRKKPSEEFEMECDLAAGTVLSSVHREWSENGRKKHEVRTRNGKITSAEYFDPDGKLGAEIKEGNGWSRQWHDNGRVCQESPYGNGVIEGEEKDFDEAGRVQVVTTYAGGKYHGPHRRLDEAGTVRVEGAYAANEKHGTWIRRDEKGKEIARSVFEKGKRVSGDDPFEN
jgi:antitoxin component YwqK of YwqJK toxin-antitoxin module